MYKRQPKPTRIQGTFVRDEEISRVLDFIKSSATVQYDEAMIEAMEKHDIQDGKKGGGGADAEEDEPAGLHLGVPDWMSGVLRWGHTVSYTHLNGQSRKRQYRQTPQCRSPWG